jgi:hypothetical protein
VVRFRRPLKGWADGTDGAVARSWCADAGGTNSSEQIRVAAIE